jgi:ankyrin repeat protein
MDHQLEENIDKIIEEEDISALELILPKLNREDTNRWFVLSSAWSKSKVCKYFLDNGWSAEEEDLIGGTAAIKTITENGTSLLKLFLENGVNPNSLGSGDSMLGWACRQDNAEAVKLLLEFGADQNIKHFRDIQPPLFYAVHAYLKDTENAKRIVSLLLEYKPDFKWKKNKLAVTRACELGNYELAKDIIEGGKLKLKSSKQFSTDYCSTTPLQYVASTDNTEFAQYLIDKGAQVIDDDYRSSLKAPIAAGQVAMFDLLVKNGAIPEKSDDRYKYHKDELEYFLKMRKQHDYDINDTIVDKIKEKFGIEYSQL